MGDCEVFYLSALQEGTEVFYLSALQEGTENNGKESGDRAEAGRT